MKKLLKKYRHMLYKTARHMGFNTVREARAHERFAYYYNMGYIPLLNFFRQIFVFEHKEAEDEYQALLDWCKYSISLWEENKDEPVFCFLNTTQTLIEECKTIEGMKIYPPTRSYSK